MKRLKSGTPPEIIIDYEFVDDKEDEQAPDAQGVGEAYYSAYCAAAGETEIGEEREAWNHGLHCRSESEAERLGRKAGRKRLHRDAETLPEKAVMLFPRLVFGLFTWLGDASSEAAVSRAAKRAEAARSSRANNPRHDLPPAKTQHKLNAPNGRHKK